MPSLSNPPHSYPFAWTRSLRFRLTVWFGGVLALILAAGALCVYVAAKHALISETDAFLTLEAQRTSAIAQGSDENAGEYGELREAISSFQETGQTPKGFPGVLRFDTVYVRLASPQNGTIAMSPSLAAEPDILRSLASLDLPAAKKGRFFEFAGPDEERMTRVIVAPLRAAGQPLVMEIAIPWDHDSDVLEQIGLLLALAVPILALVASLGGWVLVGGALRPIQRIATEAEALEIDNFSGSLLPEAAETDSEVGHLVATLNRMTVRLHKAFEAKQRFAEAQQRFAADASHELRTPLTILRGEMELARTRPRSNEEYTATIDSALEEIQQMTHIVESLSFLAHADMGRIRNEPSLDRIDMRDLVERIAAQFEREAEINGVTLSVTGVGDPIHVLGEVTQLQQLVRNLVDNAIKYSRWGDLVTIETTAERSLTGSRLECVVTVSDMGVGIAQADLPYIFERFWRADSARSAPGSGLGLAISKQIAEGHGGQITVQSELGSGTQVQLRLPATEIL